MIYFKIKGLTDFRINFVDYTPLSGGNKSRIGNALKLKTQTRSNKKVVGFIVKENRFF